MLSPSDFNNAVPKFTNGNYASNPLNPQYIAEPSATEYNRGAEPLQTLPAQWWNWFLNKFTGRFNKVNTYVKNIFDELTQLMSLVSMSPSGTESTPTIAQLKTMFETEYPKYMALLMYPVGSIYWTGKAPDDGGDPNVLFGGTWVQIKGKFVWAKGDSDTLNATGGAKTVTLTTSQIPSHHHSFTPSGTIGNKTATGTITGGSYDFSGSRTTTEESGSIHTHSFTTGGMSGNATGAIRAYYSNMQREGNITVQAGYFSGQAGGVDSFGSTSNNAAIKLNVSHTHSGDTGYGSNDHSHAYRPSGTVTVAVNPTFTGTPHNHSFTGTAGTTGNEGDGSAHENMPPYVVKYCWERTA